MAQSDDKMLRTEAREKALPDEVLVGDKTNREIELEKLGDINILQRYRFAQHVSGFQRSRDRMDEQKKYEGDTIFTDPFISHHLFCIEEQLREVVQGEASIRSQPNAKNAQDARKHLETLNQKYWKLELKWWHRYSSLIDGPQRRAFDLWRSHPKWYMHSALFEDCAGRGGCCARGCGCCSHREPSAKRPHGVGHCTIHCACCEKARGFKILAKDWESLKEDWESLLFSNSGHRIVRVAMWGLVGGVDENPFDMIRDEPPSYSQIQASDGYLDALGR